MCYSGRCPYENSYGDCSASKKDLDLEDFYYNRVVPGDALCMFWEPGFYTMLKQKGEARWNLEDIQA